MTKYKDQGLQIEFTVVLDKNGEYALRVNDGKGNYAGIGSLNSAEEATRVASTLNCAVTKCVGCYKKWAEYFLANKTR